MPSPDSQSNSKSATPDVEAVVFVTDGCSAIWTGHNYDDLQAFIDDMDALGFPTWVAGPCLFVFTGAADS